VLGCWTPRRSLPLLHRRQRLHGMAPRCSLCKVRVRPASWACPRPWTTTCRASPLRAGNVQAYRRRRHGSGARYAVSAPHRSGSHGVQGRYSAG
jgi:hypothetical protein